MPPKAKKWNQPRGTKPKKNPKDSEYYFNLNAITKTPKSKPKLHVPKAIKRLNASRGAPVCQAPKRGVRGHTRTGKPVKGYCRNPGAKMQSGAGIKKHVKRAAKIAAFAVPAALAAYGVHKANQMRNWINTNGEALQHFSTEGQQKQMERMSGPYTPYWIPGLKNADLAMHYLNPEGFLDQLKQFHTASHNHNYYKKHG